MKTDEKIKIFDYEKLQTEKENIYNAIKAEYKYIQISILGGKENVALMIRLSLDKKETWEYGIFENSKYYHFHIDNYGSIENFSNSHRVKKVRKKRVKNLTEAIEYINKKIGG